MKFSDFWNILRGKPFLVEGPDGRTTTFVNYWQYLRYLHGKSFAVEMPDDYPRPDLDSLRSMAAANPTDPMIRLRFGGRLATSGSPEEAYREYLEAIRLLSNEPIIGEVTSPFNRRLSNRAYAHYLTARVLEQMGRATIARQHWQGCADDTCASIPQKDHKKYLGEDMHYQEAIAKLQ